MRQSNHFSIILCIALTVFVIFSAQNARAGIENCDYLDNNRYPTEYKACVAGEISAPETAQSTEAIVDGGETQGLGLCYQTC